ncbi:citryl-CoA lyase [Jiangella anatolica]|uniref:citrate synthase (unknown stereospecificity) n=1 Tax=Jiangella anatolica TaxID=2670374 RepID=A0A2W2B7U7_9ACTN|nr:citryl-CoA lyase [Jiangella anatolica]PZF83345.1 citryl-CoA lyase [Jiangella anatolica]
MQAEDSSRIQWRTAVADPHTGDDVVIRGYSLLDLIDHVDFVSGIYLVLTGELPTEPRRRMLDTMLVSIVDHGISPSSAVARMISASGVPLQASVAGGLLTFGDIHGGAGEEFARFLSETVAEVEAGPTTPEGWTATAERIVTGHRAAKRRIPGYGHPQHPNGDPRAPRLVGTAARLGVAGPHVALALALEAAIERSGSRRIPMNIDGALGSIMLDIGLDWRHARAVCMIARTCGLAAHAVEETVRERGWRGIPFDTVDYDGPAPRPLPGRYVTAAGGAA